MFPIEIRALRNPIWTPTKRAPNATLHNGTGYRLEVINSGKTASSFCSRIRTSIGNAIRRTYRLIVGKRSVPVKTEASRPLPQAYSGNAYVKFNHGLVYKHCEAQYGIAVARARNELIGKLPSECGEDLQSLNQTFDEQHDAMFSGLYDVRVTHAERLAAAARPSIATNFWLACGHTHQDIFKPTSPEYRQSMEATFSEYPQWKEKLALLPPSYLKWAEQVSHRAQAILKDDLCVPRGAAREDNRPSERAAN